VRAAGYSGWVVLIDEVELIGTYSLLQRARSYIEIGRIMAGDDSGMTALPVLAITEDFTRAVLQEKCDMDKVPRMLQDRAQYADAPDSSMALAGMRILAEKGLSLKRPDENALDETYGRIRTLSQRAYDWEPPVHAPVRREQSTPLRAYIRRWITEWDLHRLHPGSAVDIETAEWHTDYSETESAGSGGETSSDQSLIDDVLGDI
jgi:hypothetical protein